MRDANEKLAYSSGLGEVELAEAPRTLTSALMAASSGRTIYLERNVEMIEAYTDLAK